MTLYENELNKIRTIVYSNEKQVNTVIGVRNYMDNNYHYNISLDELSRDQFVSKFHLLRLFKKYYGQTPRQYLIDKRIEKSKDQLALGVSVTETCFAVGLESVGSFSTLFKKRIGKSPSKFREEQLSRRKIDEKFGTLNLD